MLTTSFRVSLFATQFFSSKDHETFAAAADVLGMSHELKHLTFGLFLLFLVLLIILFQRVDSMHFRL